MIHRPVISGVYRCLLFLLLLAVSGAARAAAPAPSEPAPSEPATIRFQFWADIYSKPIFEKIVADFNRAHPHIRVIPQLVPGRGYEQKLLIQVAGRTAPDVLAIEVSNFIPMAEKDVLLPLNRFFESDPHFRLTDYYPEIVRRFTRDGKLYALPRDTAPVRRS